MSEAEPVLVLDADGVFLSERPYWNTALCTALDLAGLADRGRGRWDVLAGHAFGTLGLQRLAKSRGCNSNWDLAAVLVRALGEGDCRQVVDWMLADDREYEAMRALARAGELVWENGHDGPDPLLGAGIDRGGRLYAEVVDRFQQVFHGTADLGWAFERWQLRGDDARTRGAFEQLVRDGHRLRVCTGRYRAEIEEPIRRLGLGEWLPAAAITSTDEVTRAERESGSPSLGKPHWFAPACAVLGYTPALAALTRGSLQSTGARAIYAGDAWADFRAVQGCREHGLELDYVHVRSGTTTPEQEREVAAAAGTLGIVETFDAIPGLLS